MYCYNAGKCFSKSVYSLYIFSFIQFELSTLILKLRELWYNPFCKNTQYGILKMIIIRKDKSLNYQGNLTFSSHLDEIWYNQILLNNKTSCQHLQYLLPLHCILYHGKLPDNILFSWICMRQGRKLFFATILTMMSYSLLLLNIGTDAHVDSLQNKWKHLNIFSRLQSLSRQPNTTLV